MLSICFLLIAAVEHYDSLVSSDEFSSQPAHLSTPGVFSSQALDSPSVSNFEILAPDDGSLPSTSRFVPGTPVGSIFLPSTSQQAEFMIANDSAQIHSSFISIDNEDVVSDVQTIAQQQQPLSSTSNSNLAEAGDDEATGEQRDNERPGQRRKLHVRGSSRSRF